MSYILEALKKAQAERQLGNAPTIHALQPAQAAEPRAAASRKPLLVGLSAGALVVAAGALLVWHRAPAPASPVAGTVLAQAGAPTGDAPAAAAAAPRAAGTGVAVTAPTVGAAPAVGRAPGASSTTVASTAVASTATPSDRLEVSAPPAPAHPARAPDVPARTESPASRAGTAPQSGVGAPPSAASGRPTPAALPAAAAAAPRTAAAAQAPAPSPEDSLPYLHQLPDAVQRDLPRVSFGGYMYSANPADRLLLVDKTLRHEGEEVAPGLVLEKLLPKAAVMNYRGVRYRVSY